MIIRGYIRLMICIGKDSFLIAMVSTYTYTNTSVCISYPKVPPKRCLTCVCVFHSTACVHIPQKDFKTRKKEKHATKIPSSRGLFIEDSSVFFVSGPRVKKKRGEKEKRENSKKITGKNGKKRISKKEKKKEQNQQEFMVAYCFVCVFSFKKSTKAKTKGITDTDLSQEKTQDQRKLFLDVVSFSPPAEENGCHCLWSLSLSFKPCLVPEPNFFWELGGVGEGWEKGNVEQ